MESNNNIKVHQIDKVCMTKEQFIKYIIDRNYNDNMFDINGNINPNYNSFKKTGTIANILEDHWDEYYILNKDKIEKYRPNANDEISKVIDCHNKNLGCSVYECPNCHDFIFVGHTCKSRFCSSCGYKYKLKRVDNILKHAYNCSHRQIVFTIPKELRIYFFHPFEEMMDILFKAVEKTIYSILNESYKTRKGKRKNMMLWLNMIRVFLCFYILLVET